MSSHSNPIRPRDIEGLDASEDEGEVAMGDGDIIATQDEQSDGSAGLAERSDDTGGAPMFYESDEACNYEGTIQTRSEGDRSPQPHALSSADLVRSLRQRPIKELSALACNGRLCGLDSDESEHGLLLSQTGC